MKMNFKPIGIDKGYQITPQSHFNFIYLIQKSVLLGLKETGVFNEMQHRQAEAALLEQYRETIRANAESAADD